MKDFIKEARKSYTDATGQMADDHAVSNYALAYQIALLNDNVEDLLDAIEDVQEQKPEKEQTIEEK